MKNLMIIGNFSSDTGYAWATIGEYFLALSEKFLDLGGRAVICYPKFNGSTAIPNSGNIEYAEFDFKSSRSTDLIRLIKMYRPDTLYLTDRPTFSMKYLVCRLAGVGTIVAHYRTKGDSEAPGTARRLAKRVLNRIPYLSVDVAVAVSDFIGRCLMEISCFPANRIYRIWNGVDINRFAPGNDGYAHETLGIPSGRRLILSCSRADRSKGIEVLIQAADLLVNGMNRRDLFFLHAGDGPDLDRFREMIGRAGLDGYFRCPGKIPFIERVTRSATIVVVPSLCEEAFGLTVVEGMASGKIVIASRIGGIVEIIEDEETGFLVPPGDSRVLASKIDQVMREDDDYRIRIGAAARRTVERNFNIEEKKEELFRLFEKTCGRRAH